MIEQTQTRDGWNGGWTIDAAEYERAALAFMFDSADEGVDGIVRDGADSVEGGTLAEALADVIDGRVETIFLEEDPDVWSDQFGPGSDADDTVGD